MINPTTPATPDESPLAALQRLLLLHDADRREYLAGLDAAAKRAGRTRTAFESWLDEIPFHNRPLDLSSVTGKRTILGGEPAPVAWYDRDPTGDAPARVIPAYYQQNHVLPGIYDDEPLSGGGGGGWSPAVPEFQTPIRPLDPFSGQVPHSGLPGFGALLPLIPFLGLSGDTPASPPAGHGGPTAVPGTSPGPDPAISPQPGDRLPAAGVPRDVSPQAAPAAPQPEKPVSPKPVLPPAPILDSDDEQPPGVLPPAIAGQDKGQPQRIAPLPITPDQSRLGPSGGAASGAAQASSSTSGSAAKTGASPSADAKTGASPSADAKTDAGPSADAKTDAGPSADAKAGAEQGVKPPPKPAYQPINQTDVPQDQVRVMRDGAAAVLPRSQVSQEEIAAVTAPPPVPFKEPKPGEAADFTGQALRDYVTIPDAAGLIHKELAGESIGAWVSAALENHQPVTATVNGKRRTIVAVDAGNMLLDNNGQALDPYRLVFGDPKGTVLSIGPRVEASDQAGQDIAPAPGINLTEAPDAAAPDATSPPVADLPNAVDEPKGDGSKTWVIGADEPAGWAKLAPTAVKQEKRKTYIFDIDSLGRTVRAKGLLVLDRTQGRNTQNQAEAGGTYRLDTDQGGHAIPRVFGGPTEKFNHLAQDKQFNKSPYVILTNQWVDAVEKNRKVYVDITLKYDGDSLRPSSFFVKWNVDGVSYEQLFPNKSGNKVNPIEK